MRYITAENYKDMSKRVNKLDSDDTVIGSSNFGKFIKLLEDNNYSEEAAADYVATFKKELNA